MKLIASKTDKHKGKEYFKYLTIIPSKSIKKLGWKKGDELDAEVVDNELRIRKK